MAPPQGGAEERAGRTSCKGRGSGRQALNTLPLRGLRPGGSPQKGSRSGQKLAAEFFGPEIHCPLADLHGHPVDEAPEMTRVAAPRSLMPTLLSQLGERLGKLEGEQWGAGSSA